MKKVALLLVFVFMANLAKANYMLVQNVTTTGNNVGNKTIQVQFDISWDNSWRDAINWDAAWVFLKFKTVTGVWEHAMLNTSGFANGAGTANTIKVSADHVGANIYRSTIDTGLFNATAMQLQWNYGLSGLTNVTGLELRVYAIEMVYVPQGDYTLLTGFSIDGSSSSNWHNNIYPAGAGPKYGVINKRLTPTLTLTESDVSSNLRIKGDAGIDGNNDGIVDYTNYPTGYNAFYSFKYELSEQQYADFFNTLTSTQIATLGDPSNSYYLSSSYSSTTNIRFTNGEYFSPTPNRSCISGTEARIFAYADWAGLRPKTFLELSKECLGPYEPCNIGSLPPWNSFGGGYDNQIVGTENGTETLSNGGNYVATDYGLLRTGIAATNNSTRSESGAGYYGIMDLAGNGAESVVRLSAFTFIGNNGDGKLDISGNADVIGWSTGVITYIEIYPSYHNLIPGFRFVRSAE